MRYGLSPLVPQAINPESDEVLMKYAFPLPYELSQMKSLSLFLHDINREKNKNTAINLLIIKAF
jgi:hypothetical protein